MQRGSVVAAGVLTGVLAIGAYLFGRDEHTSTRDVDVDVAAAPQHESARMGKPPAARPPTSAITPIERAPLPPDGTPLAMIHDDLAARAKAGDNAAAMRLAFDLQGCALSFGMSEDRAIDRFLKCEGVTAEHVEARGEWLLLAAERGDAEAMVCYAAAPADFGPKFLSDAWFDWSQRWRERAPGFAARAYELGRADVLPLLAESLSATSMYGERYSFRPLGRLMPADGARAAAMAEMSRRIWSGSVRDVPQTNYAGESLSETDRLRAQAIVDRDWPRFASSAPSNDGRLPCRRLFASMK